MKQITLPYNFFVYSLYLYLFVDVFKRYVNLSAVTVLTDLVLLISLVCFFSFSISKKFYVIFKIPVLTSLMVAYLVCLVFISNIYGISPSFSIFVVSLKVYIFPVFFIFLGCCFISSLTNVSRNKLIKKIESYIVLIVFIALIQYVGNFIGLKILPPLEHAIHSWNDDEVSLVTSGFASSKKFSRILLILSLLTFILNYIEDKKSSKVMFATFIGLAISGSRESLVLYIIFLTFLMLPKVDYFSEKQKRIFFLFFVFSMFILYHYIAQNFVFVNFLLSVDDPLSYVKRFMMLLPIFSLDLTSEIYQLGIGASRFGVETKLVPSLREQVDLLLPQISPDIETNFGMITFVDSGGMKFLVEFGYAGLFLILLALISLTVLTIKNLFFNFSRYGLITVPAFFLFVLFLKGHSVISDVVLSSIFYFIIGLMVAKNRRLCDV